MSIAWVRGSRLNTWITKQWKTQEQERYNGAALLANKKAATVTTPVPRPSRAAMIQVPGILLWTTQQSGQAPILSNGPGHGPVTPPHPYQKEKALPESPYLEGQSFIFFFMMGAEKRQKTNYKNNHNMEFAKN